MCVHSYIWPLTRSRSRTFPVFQKVPSCPFPVSSHTAYPAIVTTILLIFDLHTNKIRQYVSFVGFLLVSIMLMIATYVVYQRAVLLLFLLLCYIFYIMTDF